MKQLSCMAMGENCDFVAEGENEMQVITQMNQHAKEEHPDVWARMEKMSPQEKERMEMEMRSKMEDV